MNTPDPKWQTDPRFAACVAWAILPTEPPHVTTRREYEEGEMASANSVMSDDEPEDLG